MSPRLRPAGRTRGGAFLALPLLLGLASGLGAAGFRGSLEKPHLDGGARWLSSNNGSLDAAAHDLGLPVTGGQWLLWGGGATLTRPELRLQASGWTGHLRAARGSESSEWHLHLAELSLEQRYEQGPLLVTGGATLNHGQLHGTLQGPGGHSSVRAPLWGGGLTAGLRWPRQTPLGFFGRGGWLWLMGQGHWRGDQADQLKDRTLDLSGPSLTAQVELAF